MLEKTHATVFGLIGNAVAWAGVTASYMLQLQQTVQTIAALSAIIASLITARYYFYKTQNMKKDGSDKDS